MENKSEKYVKRILLCIAFIPYIILICACLYYAINGYGYYDNNFRLPVYGLGAIENYLRNLLEGWSNLLVMFVVFPIIFLWIGYQIYHRVIKENKKELKDNNKDTSKSIKFKKIIFYICIGCWCLYFASSIFVFFFGFNAYGTIAREEFAYGTRGMLMALFLAGRALSIIPVLPISLLYIIIYVIVNRRKKKKEAIGKANIDQTNIEN